MADWSDLVGLTLTAARARADRYGHDPVVDRIADEVNENRPGHDRPCVNVAIDNTGERARVIAVTGDEGPRPRPVAHGRNAAEYGMRRPLEVMFSARGYYIGTGTESGPLSLESHEFWADEADAETALATGAWTQRDQA